MIAEELDAVSEAFGAALAAHEAGVAIDDLTVLCHGDAAVAAEVRSLLDHLGRAGDSRASASSTPRRGFLDCNELRHDQGDAAGSSLLKEWGASSIGQRIGPYTLIGELGSGGMAVVFLAEQDRPRRDVALKLVRRSGASHEALRRFEREAEMHGCLNHPGVARVYDAGVAQLADDAGRTVDVPYLAMERVQGMNVAEFCRAFRNDRDLVLDLVGQMCDAVQHAHQRGIIHRDLKPANVLVTGGAKGEPAVKLLDFGVARLRNETTPDPLTRLTQDGHVLGTLAYMSPEQLGANCDVDTRSDVYALGVILYELLAGRHPIDLAGCGFAEAAVRIAQRRPARLGTVERKLRGDVETIVAKALEKEPDRRYQSPADLADDLRRTARGDPIQARRESIAYTLSRQVARYRSLAAVSMVLMFVSILLAIYVHSEQSLKLRVVNAEAQSMRREQASRQKADGLAAELAIRLSASRISEGRLLSASGAWIDAERPLWDEYLAHPTSLDAHFALRELYLRSGCRTTFSATTREARSLAVSGNGLIAVGDADGMIHLRRSEDGRPAGGVSAGVGALRAACFLGDGETLAAAGAGGARLVTAAGLNRTLTTQPATAVTATRSLLAIGEDVGWISLFTADGEPLLRVHAATSSVRAIGIDASEKNLVSIHNDGSIRLWRIDRDERGVRLSPGPPIAGHTAAGRTIVFSPDGRTIASGGSDQMIRLWRSADGEALTAVRTKNGTSRDIVFDPTGRQLAVAGYWRTQLFDLTPGEPYLAAARGVDGESLMCRFAENGRSLVTLRTAGVCHVWDLQPDGPVVLRGASSAAVESLLVTRSADEGPLMISAQADGAVTVRSCSGQRQWTDVATWSLGFAPRALAFDRTKDELWVGREDGHAVAYGLLNGRIADNLPDLDAPVRTIDLSPDGQTLVVGLGDGRVTFWRRSGSTWNKLAEGQCGTDVRGASISPDGRTLFTTHRPALLRTWSMTDGRILGELTRPTASYHPAFHPGGAFVAAGDWDRAVHLWDPAKIGPAAEPLLTLVGHNQLVSEVAYDDTGSLLASVATDGQWRLWDARPSDNPVDSRRPERECLASYDALTGEAVTLRFLPTEKGRPSVVVGFRDGTVRIWDLAAGDRYLAGNADYQRKLRADAIALGKGAERNTAAPSPP